MSIERVGGNSGYNKENLPHLYKQMLWAGSGSNDKSEEGDIPLKPESGRPMVLSR
jgi:hypothetical protein